MNVRKDHLSLQSLSSQTIHKSSVAAISDVVVFILQISNCFLKYIFNTSTLIFEHMG